MTILHILNAGDGRALKIQKKYILAPPPHMQIKQYFTPKIQKIGALHINHLSHYLEI